MHQLLNGIPFPTKWYVKLRKARKLEKQEKPRK